MHKQDMINEAALKFIKELDGKEFTVQHFRDILFGNCSNFLKSLATENVLIEFNKHPSVQLRGVGMNGIIMERFLTEIKEEKEMWKILLIKEILRYK